MPQRSVVLVNISVFTNRPVTGNFRRKCQWGPGQWSAKTGNEPYNAFKGYGSSGLVLFPFITQMIFYEKHFTCANKQAM